MKEGDNTSVTITESGLCFKFVTICSTESESDHRSCPHRFPTSPSGLFLGVRDSGPAGLPSSTHHCLQPCNYILGRGFVQFLRSIH